MAKTKGSSKKQQKRGVDFKKIKRKLGRKLPPPKNATNTEIKSKAIILPEQSVASERTGLAVSKKGLTLKELLQQTSHHNAKVRKDALMGMRDLLHKYPEELKSHRYAVIEKLRERISDDDKVVRETLYQLLKSVILPGCKEDNQGPFISLMMVYIFNAMTHLSVDVRLMAFKFFDLVVQYYPPSFSMYAEKILQNYEDFLRKNQFYLEEKGKLKTVLGGLMQCLLLLPPNRNNGDLSKKDSSAQKMLHAFEPDLPTVSAELSIIMKKLKDLVPVLVHCFQDFISLIHSMPLLDAQSFDCMLIILRNVDLAVQFFIHGIRKVSPELQSFCGRDELTMWNQMISSVLLKKLVVVFPLNPVHHLSEKEDDRYFTLNIVITEIFLHLSEWTYIPADLLEKILAFIEDAFLGKLCGDTQSRKAQDKQMLTLIRFIPKLLSQVMDDWRSRLLQAFTKTFQDCSPESCVKLACLSAIEEILISRDEPYLNASYTDLLDHQITWMRELPLLLILLGDKHPSSSQVVLHLLLRLGQCSLMNSFLALEYDNLQYSLQEFYSTCDEGKVCHGPFLQLGKDSQELSVCCLYYFSHLESPLLKSIASCCLCPDLDALMLFRIIEVLHSAYKAGHIQIANHISFFITLVSRFEVFPENIYPAIESDSTISNRGTFKSMTSTLCSDLLQMGDNSLVFRILERMILELLSSKPPLDNACAMLRMLVVLDSKPTRLCDDSIFLLSNLLSRYLIDVGHCVSEDDVESMSSHHMQTWRYYILPCFFLFDRSRKLFKLVLIGLGSLITEGSPSFFGDPTSYCMDHFARIDAVVTILLLIHQDAKIQQFVSLSKSEIDNISQRICSLQSSLAINLTPKERHRIQHSLVRLKTITSSAPGEQ